MYNLHPKSLRLHFCKLRNIELINYFTMFQPICGGRSDVISPKDNFIRDF